jgi:hypothetical protein
MKGKYVKVPAEADEHIDQPVIDMGVKYVKVIRKDKPTEAADGKWEKVGGEMDPYVKQMIRGAKCVGLCAAEGLVLLWWLKAGLLAPAAAWPAFIVVALVAGVGLGSCLVRR